MRTSRSRHRVLASAAAVVVSSLGIVGGVAACAASRDVVGPKSVAGSPPDVLKLPARVVSGDSSGTTTLSPVNIAAVAPSTDGTLRSGQPSSSEMAGGRTTGPTRTVVRTTTRATKPTMVDGPYFEFQVEKPVTQAPGSPGPRYPDSLRVAKTEGIVMAQFVVDTLGHAIPETYKVLKSDHDLFTQAVRAALPNMRFQPALIGGRKVKQLVQQPFVFSLTK